MGTTKKSQSHYFPDPEASPLVSKQEGLQTLVLTGLDNQMMMVLSTTLPGHTVPIHKHPNEQIGMVHSGRAMLQIGDEERLVQKGDFFCIPANVPHGDTCLGDEPFVMLDIFHPVRQDFIQLVQRGLSRRRNTSHRKRRSKLR